MAAAVSLLARVALRQAAESSKSGERVILIVAIVVPVLGVLVCLQFIVYSYCCRDRRQLPAPAPVATESSVLSPRRRETFVGGDSRKLDSFCVHSRDAATLCPLCRRRLDALPVTAGRCGHLAHTVCLKNWLARGARAPAACPVCLRGLSLGKNMHREAGAVGAQASGESSNDSGEFDDVAERVSVDGEEVGWQGAGDRAVAGWGTGENGRRRSKRSIAAPGTEEEESEDGADAAPNVEDPLAIAYVRTNSRQRAIAELPAVPSGGCLAVGEGGGRGDVEDEEALAHERR